MITLAILTLLTSTSPSPGSQDSLGTVHGRVIDADRGTPIEGADLEITGATPAVRAKSKVDGRFELRGVAPGKVAIRARLIGYRPKVVSEVVVSAGEMTTQDITLAAAPVALAEVKVTAKKELAAAAQALSEQREALGVINAITAEQIAGSPDGDAAAAIQRVSGVTVQDGRYVFVRGLGARYTTTALNGARIPSPEPERKVVPLDLFPSGLLQSITTAKTFTPDLPGDFSGAHVDIRTRGFPDKWRVSVATSSGFNSRATTRSMVRAPSAGLEWLAMGSGDRQMPASLRSLDPNSSPTPDQVNAMVNSFRNSWSAPVGSGQANSGLNVSAGGTSQIKNRTIGYFVSGMYSYGQEIQADQHRAYAQPTATLGEVQPIDEFAGSTGRNSVLAGGLLNLSADLGRAGQIALNTSYDRTADNEARFESGESENLGGRFQITRLRYVERSVLANQLKGDHQLGPRQTLEWSVSRSRVTRDEPDRSEIVYALDVDPEGNPMAPAWFSASNEGAVRTFTALSEKSTEVGASYAYRIGSRSRPHSIRVGGLHRSTSRRADNRSFSIASTLSLEDRQLAPESIFDGRFTGDGQEYFRITPLSAGGSYQATDEQVAAFGMFQLAASESFEVIAGARFEHSAVVVVTEPTIGATVTTAPKYHDLLPSLVVNYRVRPNQTIRFSASRTLSRPEYRELSPVQYREVIGGENVLGNPDLQRSLITNLDTRWEWYPNPVELLSVALFAKRFQDPIEQVYLATSGTRIVTYLNAAGAESYGVEVEARKNLRFITAKLINFAAHFNATVMRSKIRIGGELASTLNDERAMVGQAPYVVNAGLGYTSNAGTFSASLLYNVVGRRIVSAAEAPLPDVYETPRQMLDFSARFPIAGAVTGKLDCRNLLDAPFRLVQGTVVRQSYRTGRVVSIGLSWQP